MKVLFSSSHLNGHTVRFDLQMQELQPPCIAAPPLPPFLPVNSTLVIRMVIMHLTWKLEQLKFNRYKADSRSEVAKHIKLNSLSLKARGDKNNRFSGDTDDFQVDHDR